MLSGQLEQCLGALRTTSGRLHNIEGDLPITASVMKGKQRSQSNNDSSLLVHIALLEGTSIKRAIQHSDSNIWFVTGRIDTIDLRGREVGYFVKVCFSQTARKDT